MGDQESVTAVVTRRIVPGRKPEYISWVHQVEKIVAQFPGYQDTAYKVKGERGECHVVFRFDTVEHLRNWELSAERQKWIEKLEDEGLVEGGERIERLTGLEFLFANQLHPKANKMALVLIVIIFTMMLMLEPVVSFLFGMLPGTPNWLILLFRITVQVVLMTYVVMPPVTRCLASWLAR